MLVGETSARLGLDMSSFNAGLQQAHRQLSTTDGAVGRSTSVWGRMGETMKNAVSFAGGMAIYNGLKMAIEGVAKAGIGFNATMETNNIALTTMLGSADKAKAMLADLTTFAANTPFELPQVMDATKKMLAFGFAAKDVKPMLTSVGDAAAGLGMGADGMNRIIVALGQMKAKGKIQAGEMLQLTEAGIPAWDMLAKAMGKSTAEVMKLSEKGLLPADKAIGQIVAGMETKFPNMMAAQSKSFTGLMSTLKDNVQITFGQVMKPAFDWLVSDVMPKAIDLTGKFQQGFGQGGLAGALVAIVPAIKPVIDGISNIGETMRAVFSGDAMQTHDALIDLLGFSPEATKQIMDVAGQIREFLTQFFSDYVQIAQTNFNAIMDIVKLVWPDIQRIILEVAKIVMQVIQTAWPIIKQVIAVAQDAILAIIKTAWPIIMDVVKFAMDYIVPFLVSTFTKIAEFIGAIMPAIKTIIHIALLAIKDVWSVIWPILKAVVVPIFEVLKTVISVAMDLIMGIIRIALDLITGHWGDAWRGLKTMVINIWQDIWGGIKGIINLIIGGINSMVDGINKVQFNVPDWVPVLGGAHFGLNIPHIPTLHTGGTFRAATPGGEGYAKLRDGERVTPRGGNTYNVNVYGGNSTITEDYLLRSLRRAEVAGLA